MTPDGGVAVLLVLAGSALGAPARYLADRWVQSWHSSAFPWGTWLVNVVGSALWGVLAAGAIIGAVPGTVMAGVGFGFCGALTTYSTFGYETIRLLEDGYWRPAMLNVVASLIAGLAAAFGGALLATVLWH